MMYTYPYYGAPNRFSKYNYGYPHFGSNVSAGFPHNSQGTPSNSNVALQKTNTSSESHTSSENRTSSDEKPIFELFGIKLYYDDVLLICLIFFLYQEGVQDQYLFISLILLLLS